MSGEKRCTNSQWSVIWNLATVSTCMEFEGVILSKHKSKIHAEWFCTYVGYKEIKLGSRKKSVQHQLLDLSHKIEVARWGGC